MTDEDPIAQEPPEDDEDAPAPLPLPEGTELPANDPVTNDEEEGT